MVYGCFNPKKKILLSVLFFLILIVFNRFSDDPVSTVRLCVVNLTPVLKQMLVIPVDRNLQIKLESMISKIEMVEADKDVIYALKCKLKEMRNIHGMNTEQLIEEKRKIEEEEKILQGRINRSGINAHMPKMKSISKYKSFKN